MLDWEEVVDKAIDFFKDNEGEFEACIDDLNSWNGWPEENGTMYYPMDMLDDHFYHRSATEIIDAVDLGNFSTSDDYYYEDSSGYICSTDDRDYSDLLDRYFIDELYDCKDDIDLPSYIEKLFEAFEDEDEEDEEDEDEEDEDFDEDEEENEEDEEESEDEDFSKE